MPSTHGGSPAPPQVPQMPVALQTAGAVHGVSPPQHASPGPPQTSQRPSTVQAPASSSHSPGKLVMGSTQHTSPTPPHATHIPALHAALVPSQSESRTHIPQRPAMQPRVRHVSPAVQAHPSTCPSPAQRTQRPRKHASSTLQRAVHSDGPVSGRTGPVSFVDESNPVSNSMVPTSTIPSQRPSRQRRVGQSFGSHSRSRGVGEQATRRTKQVSVRSTTEV